MIANRKNECSRMLKQCYQKKSTFKVNPLLAVLQSAIKFFCNHLKTKQNKNRRQEASCQLMAKETEIWFLGMVCPKSRIILIYHIWFKTEGGLGQRQTVLSTGRNNTNYGQRKDPDHLLCLPLSLSHFLYRFFEGLISQILYF